MAVAEKNVRAFISELSKSNSQPNSSDLIVTPSPPSISAIISCAIDSQSSATIVTLAQAYSERSSSGNEVIPPSPMRRVVRRQLQ